MAPPVADGCQTCGLVVHRLPAEIQRPTVDGASFVLVRFGSTAYAPAKPRATLARVAGGAIVKADYPPLGCVRRVANTRRCRPVFGLKAAVLDVLEWMSRRQFWPWRCNRRINQTRQLFSRLKTPAFSIAGRCCQQVLTASYQSIGVVAGERSHTIPRICTRCPSGKERSPALATFKRIQKAFLHSLAIL